MSPRVVLQGITGSTAYGLAREGSDVDRLGVFTVTARELLGLDWSAKKETIVRNDPDSTHHELGKFVRLLLNGNPTVSELLWLDEYEIIDYVYGQPLVNERMLFLSQRTVRRAYLGYATDQLRRAEARADGTFGSDTKKRSLKHARHCLRLLEQAQILHEYGWLPVRAANPAQYFRLDEMAWEDVLRELRTALRVTEHRLDTVMSPLPPTLDRDKVRDLLDSLRAAQNWYGERGEEITWASSSGG